MFPDSDFDVLNVRFSVLYECWVFLFQILGLNLHSVVIQILMLDYIVTLGYYLLFAFCFLLSIFLFFFFPRCDNRPNEGSSQILVALAYSCISCSNSFKPILLTFRFLFCVLFFPSVRRNPAKVVEKKNRVAQQNHYGN